MSSATFETSLTHQKRRASWIYLFIVMLHDCFTNYQILHILKLHLHLRLQKHPHEATDMLNLFKTLIIPIILLAPIFTFDYCLSDNFN